MLVPSSKDVRVAAGILMLTLKLSSAQDSNCDFSQNISPGQTYYAFSPNYGESYPAGVQCRWIATCPAGYKCFLSCTDVNLPESKSCSLDRLLVSKSGNPSLTGAEMYCGRGSFTAVSDQQVISIGLITSKNTSGGRFLCEITAQPTTDCRCGYKGGDRIVGGQETKINEYPAMAGVVDVAIKQIKCGAIIIDSMYVLTAAHCLANQNTSTVAVVVGEHDVSTADSPATRAYRVTQFIIHPQFNDNNYDNDIALLKVQGPIQFSDRVGPVCLPFKFASSDLTGRKVTVLGWGTLFFGGPSSNVLRKVDVDIVSSRSCQSNIPGLTAQQICTYTAGKDACQDDSGGPLLYTDPDTKLMFNVGIVSYGKSCASRGQPGVNTRVTAFLDWIIRNTPGSNYCRK